MPREYLPGQEQRPVAQSALRRREPGAAGTAGLAPVQVLADAHGKLYTRLGVRVRPITPPAPGRADEALRRANDAYALAVAAEPALGNPVSDGQVLSSLADGSRSWVAMTGGTGNIDGGSWGDLFLNTADIDGGSW